MAAALRARDSPCRSGACSSPGLPGYRESFVASLGPLGQGVAPGSGQHNLPAPVSVL